MTDQSDDLPFDADGAPELAVIWRTGNRARYRRAQLFCERGGDGFAEIFQSPAGPILWGRGSLATEKGDRYRRGPIVRYLDREPDVAAVSLQCRCSEFHIPLRWLAEQEGPIVVAPRPRAMR